MNYPPLPYRLTPRPKAKLEIQVDYLNEKYPGEYLGDVFLREVIASLDWLSANYGVPSDSPTRPGKKRFMVRSKKKRNRWMILYRVDAGEIVVPTLLHPGQGPKD